MGCTSFPLVRTARRRGSADQLQDLLEARMGTDAVEIRIVVHPGLRLMVGMGEQVLEQVDRLVGLAQDRMRAGDIVLGQIIVRL